MDATNPVSYIIYEEMGTYFDGEKGLDEVLDILQRRIQLYMSENQY